MENTTVVPMARAKELAGKDLHIKRIKSIRMLPDHIQPKFDKLEMYHMAALHRKWFSSSRREKQA